MSKIVSLSEVRKKLTERANLQTADLHDIIFSLLDEVDDQRRRIAALEANQKSFVRILRMLNNEKLSGST